MLEHRYTNLTERKTAVMEKAGIEEDLFEVLESNIYDPSIIKMDELDLIRPEDDTIYALTLNLLKSFERCIPEKQTEKWVESVRRSHNSNVDQKDMKCKKHPERTATYVCVSTHCPLNFFCQACVRTHEKTCDRKYMHMNSIQIQNEDFVTEYFNPEEFDYDGKIDEIKAIVKKQREKNNMTLDIIEKIMLNKLKFQSKEFKLKQMKAKLEKHFDEYTSIFDFLSKIY